MCRFLVERLPLAVAIVRAGAWAVALWTALVPWADLGGVVPERTRLFARTVPCAAFSVGCVAGAWARERSDDSRTGPVLRALFYPAALSTLVAGATLHAQGRSATSLVAFTALLAYGAMVQPCLDAARQLSEQGIEATVINARFAKPLDAEAVVDAEPAGLRVRSAGEGPLDLLRAACVAEWALADTWPTATGEGSGGGRHAEVLTMLQRFDAGLSWAR